MPNQPNPPRRAHELWLENDGQPYVPISTGNDYWALPGICQEPLEVNKRTIGETEKFVTGSASIYVIS